MEVADKPLRPRRAEVEYLIGRMRAELERNKELLSEPELAEYRRAMRAYEEIGARAR